VTLNGKNFMSSIAHAATLAASMDHLSVKPGEMVRLDVILRQRKLFTEMNEATRGEVSLQHILDNAARTAALGCSAPMAKVLEVRRSDNELVMKGQYGLGQDSIGQTAGVVEADNPPGQSLLRVSPVVELDVRKRPDDAIPQLFKDHHVVTSVNVPLVNGDGAYGILEIDFPERTEVGALELSFLASVAGALAEDIEKHKAREVLAGDRDAKALLLREQQHRIRNNFQLIVAMARRGAMRATDENVRKSYQDIERRVFAMASIYDHLLGLSEQANCADLGRYLSAMADNFDDFYALGESEISLKIDLEFGVMVDIDACTAVGTIVNELVANSVEHAFSGRTGKISISLQRVGKSDYVVSVSDNGRGSPARELSENIGLRTVRKMLEGMGGKLELVTAPGQGMTATLRLGESPECRGHSAA
jgi:two-component sensor histidine kinase